MKVMTLKTSNNVNYMEKGCTIYERKEIASTFAAVFSAVSAITIEPFIFLVMGRLYILYPAIEHEDNRYKNYLAKAAAVE